MTKKQTKKRKPKKLPAASKADATDAPVLRQVQKQFAQVVMRPLTQDWETQTQWTDGRETEQVVAQFIKPNDRMTSLERIGLYNKQYWFRLIDIMYEDYSGLASMLGMEPFNTFCKKYLTAYPSTSGLLRNLGKHLPAFILQAPELTSPHTQMAYDVARLEWAQVQAFDAASRKPLTPADMQDRDPATTTLKLQPFISLIQTTFAVDKLVIAAKKQAFRSESSNTVQNTTHTRKRRRLAKAEPLWLLVHRFENMVYVKRIEPQAFAILQALRNKATIAQAISQTLEDADDSSDQWTKNIQPWFASWMSQGWFCKR